MGTRADFYVGRGPNAEWIGSIAWDGFPEDVRGKKSRTEAEFRSRIARFLASRDDATLPRDGWPWPWNNSATTDYAYAFDDGRVWASCCGGEWFIAARGEPSRSLRENVAVFPDMSSRKAVTYGKRSGLMIVGEP